MEDQHDILAWMHSLAWSGVVMALILAIVIPGNIAIGRTIHWDIVTVLGLGGLLALTVLHRKG